MSSARVDISDAKNRSKNITNARHSEDALLGNIGSTLGVRRIQVSEKMDPSQTQDDGNKKYSHVMCFGTFDIFHPGHEYYLSEASKLADTMTIVIARDHRVSSGKGQDPLHNENMRLQGVKHIFSEANVILGHESDIFSSIRELAPDILAFGYDQRVPEDKIRELFPDIEMIRIGGYEIDTWKSSILKKSLYHNPL